MDEVTGITMDDKKFKFETYTKLEKPKKVKKVKAKVNVVKKVVVSTIDKGTFNLDRITNRYKSRYDAKLVEDGKNEVIFESNDTTYKLKKV